MKKRRIIIGLLALAVLFTVSACRKIRIYTNVDFSSSLEQPMPDNDAKTYLSMERYIYWDYEDEIRVYSGDGGYVEGPSMRTVKVMPNSLDKKKADFSISGFLYSHDYYGIFPAACAVDADPTGSINMPTEYRYRDAGLGGSGADLTFGTPGLPMVAWSTVSDGSVPALDFHSVCGIARIQLTSAQAKTISSVTFTSSSPIAGNFTINGIKTNAPYLSAAGGTNTITITGINQTLDSKVMTFYLPLPAAANPNAASSGSYVTYPITMTVTASDASTFTADFSVKIRRNTLSVLPALNITNWSGHEASVGLAGCGTELRPFLIYSAADMIKVKKAYDSPSKQINGVPLDDNVYFSVVSSSIELISGEDNWKEGINHFKGHFTYENGNARRNGITNRSASPIFESVDENAVIEGLYVRGTNAYSGSKTPFSPLCNENRGTLSNCHNLCVLSSSNADLAGVCVVNYGTMENCANEANITANLTGGKAAGICFTNQGTLTGYNLSSALVSVVKGSEAATICYQNYGTVTNSQVTLSYTSNVNYKLGGLVFRNEIGGTISNSEALGQIRSSSEVGGICHTNRGIIDACRNGMVLISGSVRVGGIAATQGGSSEAEIRNCYNNSPASSRIEASSGVAGGIIAEMSGGKVRNCYSNLKVASVGAELYGEIAGRVVTGTIENCYNGTTLASFYGEAPSQTAISKNCFNPEEIEKQQYCCSYYRSGDANKGKVHDVSATSTSSATAGEFLVEALNRWVSNENGAGDTYRAWEVKPSGSQADPVLVMPTSISKRNRR